MPDYSGLGPTQNPQTPFGAYAGLQESLSPQYPKIDLDSIMNNAIQMKTGLLQQQQQQNALAEQLRQQNLQYGAFGINPSDVTPQNIQMANQAMQGPAPQTGSGQAAPGPAQGGSQSFPAGSSIPGLENMIKMYQANAALGVQKEQAGVNLAQGQASQAAGTGANQAAQAQQAQITNQMLAGNGQGSGLMNNLASAFGQGQNPSPTPLPLDDYSSLMSRMPEGLKVAGLNAILPQAGQSNNLAQNQINYNAKNALALTKSGSEFQVPLALANSTIPNIDKLDHLINTTAGNSWQTINKLGLTAANEMGNRPANALTTQLAIIANEVTSAIPNASTDVRYQSIMNALNSAKSQGQLIDSSQALRSLIQSKISAFGGSQTPPDSRYSQLINAGFNKKEAYQRMVGEGYGAK